MKENFPTLKNRKPSVYIFFVLYCLFGVLILGESAVPSGASANQSNAFATALAWVVNLVSPSMEGSSVAPESIAKTLDTTFLSPSEDGTPRIALGTTSLLNYVVSYPAKGQYDFYDQTYHVERTVGTSSSYDLLPSYNTETNTIALRVTGKEVSASPYQISIQTGDLSLPYSFYIVDLPRPTDGQYVARVGKTTLKVGESEPLDICLTNPSGDSPVHRSDWYLRRYYDPSKLFQTSPAFTSSDPSIISLDQNGMLHALQEGTATLSSSRQSFVLTVSGNFAMPTPSFSLKKGNEHELCMNDYDFLAQTDSLGAITDYFTRDDGQLYWTTLYGDFGPGADPSSFDSALFFSSSDSRLARVFPFTIDPSTQAFSWRDDQGRPACQIVGYRLPTSSDGNVTISAASQTNQAHLDLTVTRAVPNGPSDGSWLKTSQGKALDGAAELSSNAQLFLVGQFTPENTGDKSLHGVSADLSIVTISGDGTPTMVLMGKKEGNTTVTLSSVANPALSVSLQVSVKNPNAINEGNIDSIASFLRKAAGHFSLFLLTAVLGMIFFTLYLADAKKDVWGLLIGGGIGFLLAGFSELIQFLGEALFHFGRSGSWVDVGIDTLGYLLGALLTWGVILLYRLLKRKRAAKAADSSAPPTV